jgi:hypothetical protein
MVKDGHHPTGNIDKVANPSLSPRAEETALVCEICARLIEWRTLHPLTESTPFLWIQRIASLGQDNPDALWLYLSIQSGDLAALTETYEAQASQRASSRQAIEQKLSRASQAMSLHFPELAHTLASLQSHCRPPRGLPAREDGP